MCKNIKLLFSCSHSHPVRLSACRRTRATLKKGYQIRPFCKPHRYPTLVPRIRISTPCPDCYALQDVERLMLELLDAAIVFHTFDAPLAERKYREKLEEVDEMCAMMRGMTVREGQRTNGKERSDGEEAESGGEGSEGGQWRKKRKNQASSESAGGSPLRWELKAEDLQGDEKDNKNERQKGLPATMLSWQAMVAAVREMEVLPLTIEKKNNKEDSVFGKKDSVVAGMVGCLGL